MIRPKHKAVLAILLCLICVSSKVQTDKNNEQESQANTGEAVSTPVLILYSTRAAIPHLSTKELECLADMTYLEASGESLKGQAAIAHVALNRRDNPDFPSDVCGIFYQKTDGVCQYDFACQKRKSFEFRQTEEYREIQFLTSTIAAIPDRTHVDPTRGSLYFKRHDVKSRWFDTLVIKRKIGDHVFYAQT